MTSAEPLEFLILKKGDWLEGVSWDKAKKRQKALENRENLGCRVAGPINAAPRSEVFS
jgi:hypothetical protein